jgi:hypothetical protein
VRQPPVDVVELVTMTAGSSLRRSIMRLMSVVTVVMMPMAVCTADTGGAAVAGACTDATVVHGALVLVVIFACALALDGQDNHHHDLKCNSLHGFNNR